MTYIKGINIKILKALFEILLDALVSGIDLNISD